MKSHAEKVSGDFRRHGSGLGYGSSDLEVEKFPLWTVIGMDAQDEPDEGAGAGARHASPLRLRRWSDCSSLGRGVRFAR